MDHTHKAISVTSQVTIMGLQCTSPVQSISLTSLCACLVMLSFKEEKEYLETDVMRIYVYCQLVVRAGF